MKICIYVISFLISVLFVSPVNYAQQAQSGQIRWENEGREFLSLIQKAEYDSAFVLMTPVMKQNFPAVKMAELWNGLEKQLGKFKTVEEVIVEPLNSMRRVNLICQFDASKLNVQIVIDQNHLIAGLWLLPVTPPKYDFPSYVDTTAFHEQEVKFGLPDWQLPGTFSIPNGDSPFPAVILVHGSGPNDRDETIGPNRPFRDLAWGLASQGIMVFRYDKRTKVHGAKMVAEAITVENEVIEDVLAAVNLVYERKEVNKKQVFVVGHSLGAMLAPEIGYRIKNLTGIIMLAGPARGLEDLIIDQLKYIHALKSQHTQSEQTEHDSLLTQLKLLKSENFPDSAQIIGGTGSYFYDLHKRDQVKFAQKLQMPMLILQGERDYQVTMEDFEIWQNRLAGGSNVTFVSYPALNHLFIPGQGKSTPSEYMEKQKHVSAEVIQDISTWIKKNE